MFNLLIEVGKDGNVLLNDKSIAFCPSLFKVYQHPRMGSNMVRWIVMVYDHKSPYRNLPYSERIKSVTAVCFDKTEHYLTEDDIVKEAVEEYKKLLYNPLIDQYNAIREKMQAKTNIYKKMIPTEDNFTQLSDMEVEMEKTATSLEKIKEKILKDMESKDKIKGAEEGDLSIIEQQLELGNK